MKYNGTMRYSLRALLTALALGPPTLAGGYVICRENLIAWLFLLLLVGLVVLCIRSGGLANISRFPPT